MSDGRRATESSPVEAHHEETSVEPVTYEHYIPIEELENDLLIILQPLEEEPDLWEPF